MNEDKQKNWEKLVHIHALSCVGGPILLYIFAQLGQMGMLPHALLTMVTEKYTLITFFIIIPTSLLLAIFPRKIQRPPNYLLLLLLDACFAIIGLFAACWMLHFLVH